MNYVIEKRLPSLAEYRQLCESVGWGEIMNFAVAETALENSVTGVVATASDGRVVGMGRVVGDGAIYFYIQDIVVTPDFQKQGIGAALLAGLFEFLHDEAPAQSFIGLFSVPEAVNFYKRFTFEQRDLVGLFTVKEIIVSP